MIAPLLISLHLAAAGALPSGAEAPVFAASTSKSVQQFGRCFLSVQQRESRPVWLVPHADGVRISNAGAPGVANPYRIRFTERAEGNQLQLFLERADGSETPVLQAVKSCS